MSRLKKLVTQLLSHIQLLSTLLKDAGISVPAEPALEKISPKLWSNKITADITECFIKEQSKKQYKLIKYFFLNLIYILFNMRLGKKSEKVKRRSPLKSSLKKNSPKKSSVRKNFTATDKSVNENQENCVNGITNKDDDDSSKVNSKSSPSTTPISEQNGINWIII